MSQRYWVVLWRDPRRAWLLMWAYFLLSLVVGPVIWVYFGPATGSPMSAHGWWLDWIFSAFFAWRVARGGRISRMLLILGAGVGYLSTAGDIAHQFTPVQFSHLVIYGAQIAVLVSPAVYQRTRPEGRVEPLRRTRARLPLGVLLLGALIGSGATLLKLHWLIGSGPAPIINGAALGRDWVEGAVLPGSVLYGYWLLTWARGKPIIGDWYPPAANGRRSFSVAPAVLAVVTGLGLVSLGVCSVAIIARVDAYDVGTVHLHAGRPARVTLAAGQYGIFDGCIDYAGCQDIRAGDLLVWGTRGDVVPAPYDENDQRGQGNQTFLRALTVTIPVREQLQIALNANARQPVFLAPSEDEANAVRGWLEAALVSVAVLLVAVAGLAWRLAGRARPYSASPSGGTESRLVKTYLSGLCQPSADGISWAISQMRPPGSAKVAVRQACPGRPDVDRSAIS